ncbi:5-oxoprolinase subunit PxpA [Shewanella colwelliana]|nr:5-oxoprolinase subunit PxpA [Shewanella colwelliana]
MNGSNIFIDYRGQWMPANEHKPHSYALDLNADLGEGGRYDESLLRLITSANVACGGHIGDEASMIKTVTLAKHYQVKIGAHPSYPDPANFGRVTIDISHDELFTSLHQQINALREICELIGVKLHHVKPHGALYNQAAQNSALGQIIIDVIKAIDPKLKLMILAGSQLVSQARAQGLAVIEEAFADRRYLSSGALAPRAQPEAVIEDSQQALQQVKKLTTGEPITSLDGQPVIINATSLCVHGDNPHALSLAKLIGQQLKVNHPAN